MPQKRRASPRKSYNETLGQRLARLRREQGLSQTDLAKRLDVTQANISAYERDLARLHSDLIVTLTQILKVSADELLGTCPPSRPVGLKDRRLLRELALIDQLSKKNKEALLRTIRMYADKIRTESAHSVDAAAK